MLGAQWEIFSQRVNVQHINVPAIIHKSSGWIGQKCVAGMCRVEVFPICGMDWENLPASREKKWPTPVEGEDLFQLHSGHPNSRFVNPFSSGVVFHMTMSSCPQLTGADILYRVWHCHLLTAAQRCPRLSLLPRSPDIPMVTRSSTPRTANSGEWSIKGITGHEINSLSPISVGK